MTSIDVLSFDLPCVAIEILDCFHPTRRKLNGNGQRKQLSAAETFINRRTERDNSNLHGNDHERNASTEKPALQGKDGKVVKQACQARFTRKDKLASEEHCLWKSRHNASGKIIRGLDDVVPQGCHSFGIMALGLH